MVDSEQAAGSEVGQECGHGLIDGAGVVLVAFLQVPVLVPAVAADRRAREFNKPDPAFHQPAGGQALAAEGARRLVGGVETVRPPGGLGFPRNSMSSGTADCIRKASSWFAIAHSTASTGPSRGQPRTIEAADEAEFALLRGVGGLAAADVGDREIAGFEDRTLAGGGQETRAEVLDAARRGESRR